MEVVTGNLHVKQSLWMILLEVVLDWAFQVAPVVKNQPADAGDTGDRGSIPHSGRSSGGGRPTPVFLPGESHGQRSLVGYSPWGHRESDRTEET